MLSIQTALQRWLYLLLLSGSFFDNGTRTERSSIRSVIIRVINKAEDREAGVLFVNYEYDYIQNCTTRSPVAN